MKKLLLTAAAAILALNTFGQGSGSVNFNSIGSGNFVRDEQGGLAAGSEYRVALYWGRSTETDDRNLTQIGASAAMLSGTSAGYFNNLGRTITYDASYGTGPGAILGFQIRGWKTRGGTLTTWDSAVAAGAETGKSGIFTQKSKDDANPTELRPNIGFAPGFAGGFQIVPEPSTYALGLLGVGALLMLRRRK
jgi:hypothetical protein